MIRMIEALNYRCLRYIKQEINDFHVLVGPNASGKTTFLDVVAFLGDMTSDGSVDGAVQKRTSNFFDLLFAHRGDRFELAIELEIPAERALMIPRERNFDSIRYEVSIGMKNNEIQVFGENVILLQAEKKPPVQREIFPELLNPPKTIMTQKTTRNKRRIVSKVYEGNSNYYSEVHKKGGKGWAPSFRLAPNKSALASLPPDEKMFPASTWLHSILCDGVQQIMLNSMALRESSPPGRGVAFRPDGSNLPWVIHNNQSVAMGDHDEWVRHVQTALPDLVGVDTVERPDTRHRYLNLVYENDLSVPAWMTSDGTLRLLALTLPAWLSNFQGVYLIEEPENGIHPMAMETVYQSLKAVYDAQLLLATHSPVILGCAETSEILCFKKTVEGATDIVAGDAHPALRQWQGSLKLSDLYASGVLG